MNASIRFSAVFFLLVFAVAVRLSAYPATQLSGQPDSLTLLKQLNEVTVSGILNTKLNLPFRTVSLRDIETRVPVSPADALHHVPGILLTRDGSWATSVNLRGFSESKLLFLNDGDRIHTATDIAGALSVVDLNSIERIEIVKGAGSVLFGTGAMGGVINFVTKRPSYTKLRAFNGSVSTGLQSVNSLWHSHAAVSLAEENWYLLLDGSLRTADSYNTPLGVLPNSQFNDAGVGLRGGMRYGDSREFLVSYQHYEARNVGLPGGSAFPASAQVRYLGFVRNQLSGEYIFSDLTDVFRELRIKAYTQNVTREVENIVTSKMAIFPGSRNTTSGVKATGDLYFNDYHTLTLGAEGWIRDQLTSRVKISTVADTIFTGEQPTPKARMTDAGIFGQYRWVADPNRWIINAGIRADYIRTENDTAYKEVFKYKLSGDERTPMSHDRTVLFYDRITQELAYAVHADVEYRPARQHRLVLSLANAYRAASMEERFKYIDQSGDLRVGNPDLKAEKGVFVNLGYSFSTPRFYLKADIFTNYLFDMIAEVKELNYRLPGGGNGVAWVNKNIDQALYYGGELELKWLFAHGFDAGASVAYVYGEDRSTGLAVALLPPLNGTVELNYHLARKLNTTLSMEWEYQTLPVAGNQIRHQYLIVNWLFDTVPVELGALNLTFAGGVRNILNTAYSAWFTTLRGVNRLEPGRNIFVKATASW